MKKTTSIVIIVALLFSLCSCRERYVESSIFALDTVITFHTPQADITPYRELISGYEKVFSRTDTSSELYKLNLQSESVPSKELYSLIECSLQLSQKTSGAFDITAAALSDLWDVTSQNPRVPLKEEISSALKNTGYEKLTLNDGVLSKPQGVKIDLGAIAKGYVAQRTVNAMREDGITTGFVSFGGNIAVIGAKSDGSAWKIGIKDPRDTASVLGTVELTDGFLSVSGDYERYFMYEGVRYHHIFDLSTGCPSKSGVISAAVICSDGALCDALSTAVFVLGAEKALELYKSGVYKFEMILMFEDHTVTATPGAGFTLMSAAWEYAE